MKKNEWIAGVVAVALALVGIGIWMRSQRDTAPPYIQPSFTLTMDIESAARHLAFTRAMASRSDAKLADAVDYNRAIDDLAKAKKAAEDAGVSQWLINDAEEKGKKAEEKH